MATSCFNGSVNHLEETSSVQQESIFFTLNPYNKSLSKRSEHLRWEFICLCITSPSRDALGDIFLWPLLCLDPGWKIIPESPVEPGTLGSQGRRFPLPCTCGRGRECVRSETGRGVTFTPHTDVNNCRLCLISVPLHMVKGSNLKEHPLFTSEHLKTKGFCLIRRKRGVRINVKAMF